MKNIIVAALVSGWASISVAAELPLAVIDGVVVEEAWATTQPNGVEIYLVLNNRNTRGVWPIGIEVPGASITSVVRSDGEAFEPTLPPHAELYMQPGGVRIEVVGPFVDASVPVTVSIDDSEVTVDARVLGADELPPDHHDYDHG